MALSVTAVDVVAVHPAAALADVGDLELQAARRELLEAARGEVHGAAGEDELACAVGFAFHELEHLRLADAAAPVGAADHVGVQARVLLKPVEVDVGERAGALAEEYERAPALGVGGAHADAPSAAGPDGAASAFGGRASIASAGHPRAQVPQPRHLSSS